jgi:hypothetical protein
MTSGPWALCFCLVITEYETLSGRQLEPQITIAPGQDLRGW